MYLIFICVACLGDCHLVVGVDHSLGLNYVNIHEDWVSCLQLQLCGGEADCSSCMVWQHNIGNRGKQLKLNHIWLEKKIMGVNILAMRNSQKICLDEKKFNLSQGSSCSFSEI